MTIESKMRLFTTTVRLILTYAAETRADTKGTKQKINNVKIKLLRSTKGKTPRNK